MAKVTITNPVPHKGRVIHDMDGRARRRCRICGRTVYRRNGGICLDCLAAQICLHAKDGAQGKAVGQ